ncbi:MAG: EamA family transporter, partial [Planctomycetota bacterium]|nr:EamA family transporter [Planctomycetota bacterium]
MFFLLLNIFFSSCFILCVKWVQHHRKMDIVTVGSINYIAAAFCAVPGCVRSEFSPLAIHAIWTGATMGVCYFIAFFFLIFAVRWVGASNSAAVSRVSLVIPVCAGIGLWGEVPDFFQVLGIVTAFASLFLIGRSRTRRQRR